MYRVPRAAYAAWECLQLHGGQPEVLVQLQLLIVIHGILEPLNTQFCGQIQRLVRPPYCDAIDRMPSDFGWK